MDQQNVLTSAELKREPGLRRVVPYGSRALGRHRSGSDVDLCLDDLPLPWRFDLQLDHLITHAGLRDHIQRTGVCL